MGESLTRHARYGIIIRKIKKASLLASIQSTDKPGVLQRGGPACGLTGVTDWRTGGVPVERQGKTQSCPEKSNQQPAAAPSFIFPTRCFDTGRVIPPSPPLRLGAMRVGGVGDKSEDDGRDKRSINSIYCCSRISPIDRPVHLSHSKVCVREYVRFRSDYRTQATGSTQHTFI